jgi:hypothetical protein
VSRHAGNAFDTLVAALAAANRHPFWIVLLLALALAIVYLSSRSDTVVIGADEVDMPIVALAAKGSHEAALSLWCRLQNPPATLPATGVVPAWKVDDKADAHGGTIGLFIGPPGSVAPDNTYSCALANPGKAVSDVVLEFHLAFSNARPQESGAKPNGTAALDETSTVPIESVAQGGSFAFWIFNGTRKFVRLTLPNRAVLKQSDTGTRADTQLISADPPQLLLVPLRG